MQSQSNIKFSFDAIEKLAQKNEKVKKILDMTINDLLLEKLEQSLYDLLHF